MSELSDAAEFYAGRRFEVFPVNEHTKRPYTEHAQKDATADLEQIRRWWSRWPAALIGCRIAPGLVVLDVDPRKSGDKVWDEMERAYAPIKPRRRHHSGRGDGGHHDWFVHPGGKLHTRELKRWARANGVGQPAGKRSWSCGVDLLHHGLRYTILPPSPHPLTGTPYEWDMTEHPGPMPPFLIALLTANGAPRGEREPRANGCADSIADWFSEHHTWNQILEPAGWTVVDGDGNDDGSNWRHPNATAATSASIRHGCLFVYSDNTDFEVTEEGDPRGYTRFRAWAELEHGGDLSRAAREARQRKDGPRGQRDRADNRTTSSDPPPHTDDDAPTEDVRDRARNLPEEFWSRPELDRIRQAAHAGTSSADAVLGIALARISMLIPPTLRLATGVRMPIPLNLYVGIVDRSGGGKTTANKVARDLVPIARHDLVVDSPLGSGEGVLELFYETVTETGADDRKVKVRRKTKIGVLLSLDEGQALSEMGGRNGAVLLPVLRTAWSGEVVGQSNASEDRKRRLEADSYRLSSVVGFQAVSAGALIADATTGTPQRFVLFAAQDPNIPLDSTRRPVGEVLGRVPPTIPGQCMTVADEVAVEIRGRNVAAARGEAVVDVLDVHRDQSRARVAALLALLASRLEVDNEDWRLAGMVMDTSDAVRRWVLETNQATDDALEDARTRAGTRRQLHTTKAIEEATIIRALGRGAASIARKVHTERGRVWTGRELTHSTASRDRQHATVDEMIAHAAAMEWIRSDGDGWVAGKVKP